MDEELQNQRFADIFRPCRSHWIIPQERQKLTSRLTSCSERFCETCLIPWRVLLRLSAMQYILRLEISSQAPPELWMRLTSTCGPFNSSLLRIISSEANTGISRRRRISKCLHSRLETPEAASMWHFQLEIGEKELIGADRRSRVTSQFHRASDHRAAAKPLRGRSKSEPPLSK